MSPSPRLRSPQILWIALLFCVAALISGWAWLALHLQTGTRPAPVVRVLAPAQGPRSSWLRVAGSGSNVVLFRQVVAACQLAELGPHVPAVRVEEGIGSGGGMRALGEGVIDVALVSRPLKPDEQRPDRHVQPYARSAVVVATHPDVRQLSITTEDLAKMWMGQTAQWATGTSAHVLLREPGDSSHAVLLAKRPVLVAAEQQARRLGQEVMYHDRTMHAALQAIPGAVGLVDWSAVSAEALPLHGLALDGVAPTLAHLRDGTYPIVKELSLVYDGTPSADVAWLLRCVASPQARQTVMSAQALPLAITAVQP